MVRTKNFKINACCAFSRQDQRNEFEPGLAPGLTSEGAENWITVQTSSPATTSTSHHTMFRLFGLGGGYGFGILHAYQVGVVRSRDEFS
jgi:hypothetical protein